MMSIVLKEKERAVIQDLQTQEKSCVEKYGKYAEAADCIGTEKLVSGEYNTNVFNFGESGLRKLLADIQIEEQNHAEMLYKYKTVNQMA